MTQVLFYLGDLAPRGGEPTVSLDLAKHHIDTLGILEAKTKGNLSPEEQRLLDAALYETRMRYVTVSRTPLETGSLNHRLSGSSKTAAAHFNDSLIR